VYGWYGTLGDNTTEPSYVPVKVAGGHRWLPGSLVTTYTHVCALNTARKAFCWGYNEFGYLGIGPITYGLFGYKDRPAIMSSVPVAVAGNYAFAALFADETTTFGELWIYKGAGFQSCCVRCALQMLEPALACCTRSCCLHLPAVACRLAVRRPHRCLGWVLWEREHRQIASFTSQLVLTHPN